VRSVLSILLVALALYVVLLGVLYICQRALLYPASKERMTAAEAGLVGFQDVTLTTEDGERIVGWYRAPELGRAAVLYFHGNGGSLWNRRLRARLLTENGRGLLIISYRGYSGSTGTPTEMGLRQDARAAYDWLAHRVAPERIVLYGESLGTGVAVRLAAERPVSGVILDAPYSSTADIAKIAYWFVPVGWLMQDQFRSTDIIGQVKAPLLMLHGERDGVVPIALGERLFAAAPEPKKFVRLENVDHVSVLERGGIGPVRAFLDEVEERFAPIPTR
jgi:fermentation-respiration switch protein FrsA (DUF1100 family)